MYNIGIFIPIYFREELAKRCLLSLANSNFYQNKGIKVFLCVGINGASKNFKDNFLKEFSKKHGKNFSFIRVFDQGRNLGKPFMVNYMSQKVPKFTHLVSMDSDMVTIDPLWMAKFIYVFSMCPKKIKIGALCANQSGHSVHATNSNEHMKAKVGKYNLVTTSNNAGVAGGVLMTPVDVWNDIGGYRATNIYGSDDGSYATDCHVRNLVMGYIEELYFEHPLNNDKEYAEWKLRAAYNKLGVDEGDGFFEHMRE